MKNLIFRSGLALALLAVPAVALAPSSAFNVLTVVTATVQGMVTAGSIRSGNVLSTPASVPALLDIHAAPPANGTFIHGSGSFIDYCSVTGCLSGPHLLGGNVFNMTTRTDASAQESNVSINTTVQTGKAVDWAPLTAYALGTQVHGPHDGIYRVTTAGTSGSAGPSFCPRTYEACYYTGGPDASTGTDGTVTWAFVGAGINDGKSGFSNATFVKPGAGHTWGMNSSLHLSNGIGPIPMFGFEFDTTNDNQNYPIGGPIMANLFLNGSSSYTGTAAIFATLSGGTGSLGNYGFYYGALFQGDTYIKSATIADATSSDYVLHALGAPHVHQAVIRDDTNSPRSIIINGNHTIGIDMTGGNYGTAITLPAAGFVGFNGQSNTLGYNATSSRLQYGVSNTAPLFQIDNSGNVSTAGGLLTQNVTANSFAVGASAGVSCSGPPTSNFQVTNGIVTRC